MKETDIVTGPLVQNNIPHLHGNNTCKYTVKPFKLDQLQLKLFLELKQLI